MNDKNLMDLLKKTLLVLREGEGWKKKLDEKHLIVEIENAIKEDDDELDDFFKSLAGSLYPGISHC